MTSATATIPTAALFGRPSEPIRVEPSVHTSDGVCMFVGGTPWHFEPDAARALGAWLVERYGLPGWRPKVGDVVAVEPGHWLATGERATRAEVVRDIDEDGDYLVKVVDGTQKGSTYYVRSTSLARLDPATPAPLAVGDLVAILSGTDTGATRGVVVEGPGAEGDYTVTMVDGTAAGTKGEFTRAQLGETPAANRPWAVGDVAELNERYGDAEEGDRFRVVDVETSAVDESGGYLVTLAHLNGADFGGVFASRLRRP